MHLDKAWNLTTSYIKTTASKEGSNWLQLAIRATGLEGDRIENAFVTHSDEVEKGEFSKGPPIVVWILQLMINMGMF